jgi:hypothetical protein
VALTFLLNMVIMISERRQQNFLYFLFVELAYVRGFGIGGRSIFFDSFSSLKFLPLKTVKTVTLNRICHLKLQ